MFSYGLDPMLFESSLLASWNYVVLPSNLLQLPYFQFFNIVKQFRNLVKSIITITSLDGYAFFVFGCFGGALATQHDSPRGEVVVFSVCVPFGSGVATAAWRAVT